ncbi:MAG: aspartate--tRNA(Asn) ligase, partial [Clostridiales bacterium]|nr:aspartate--tRNA(Asn) ligase [Clostridiales bacterium]
EKKVFMFRIQTAFERLAVEYFNKNGFIEIHTPKITALSSEGGSEVFELKNYFGQKAYLTQSPQLYKQMSMMAGFDRTFEIGEYFRANPSFTSRHDTEFTGIDVEVSFIDSHHDVMDIEEALLAYVINGVKAEFNEEYKKHFGTDIISLDYKIPRITLAEAYKILKDEMNYEVPRALKGDLDPDGEKLICKYVKEKFGSDFVFIIDFPAKARAFYSMKQDENPELTKTYDLLFKGIEITSGAQREHRYENLKKNIEENGIKPESMTEYLDFFRYGAPTHGGFGLGITRTLVKLFDLPSVKDVTFLFRGPSRLKP